MTWQCWVSSGVENITILITCNDYWKFENIYQYFETWVISITNVLDIIIYVKDIIYVKVRLACVIVWLIAMLNYSYKEYSEKLFTL